MRRGWLTSLMALGGITLTVWSWMKRRSRPALLSGQMAGYLSDIKMGVPLNRLVNQISRKMRRRIRI